MMSRPAILFPLFADIKSLPGVGPKTAAALAQIDVSRPRDLIFTLPHSGIDRTRRASIREVLAPAMVTVLVTVTRHMPAATKGRPYRVMVEDAETSFQLVFFHARADWLKKQLPPGQQRLISGKLEIFDGIAQIVHPDHMVAEKDAAEIPDFEPVYPLTAGVTLKSMTGAVQGALKRLPGLDEWIDAALKARENWPDFQDAVRAAHSPANIGDIAPVAPARQRLAYDELFAHQVTLALARVDLRRKVGRANLATGQLQGRVRAALGYQPTQAQERAIREITDDLAAKYRMNRLLQGDVGSGKTLVAFMALLAVVEAGGQGVMMAPTEILARQHLESLRPLAETAGVVLEILSGRDKGGERRAKLAALKSGDIQILVGTHAVFQSDVEFGDLRLAVIDEQHRFGVSQRALLGRKGAAADVLVMTATPIPRSLSLAQYGDMDISVLDQKPPGRQPVTTAMVSAGRIDEVTDHLRRAIAQGRQAYWVCPLVQESEVSDMTAAQERFAQLRQQFGEAAVGLVHGQMPPGEKDAAMARFVAGETSVLVATTVIEVGVDVANASIMVIEHAERFGLAQLHQLRGRVGRGATASTCLLLYQPPLGEAGRRRLEILRRTDDGFVIAEEDLAMRGAGDMIGTAQSGLPKFRIADLDHQSALMALAQSDARKLLHDDPALNSDRGRAVRVLLWLMEQDK
ncbi:MAG: ATP-dependent DNA helicase RecG, partial [Paracoccaceae bacterium]